MCLSAVDGSSLFWGQYSGAKACEKLGMVLCLEATSIDRGACIRDFSQYPGEVEYLFVPCSFVEPTGVRNLEESKAEAVDSEGKTKDSETGKEKKSDAAGLLWLIHVRVNANLKSFTVEELKGRKKEMHLAAFQVRDCGDGEGLAGDRGGGRRAG